jgi:hypothetical protein
VHLDNRETPSERSKAMTNGPQGRKDRLIKEKRHDVYREREKWPEPTLCTECGALFTNGRWTWKTTDRKPNETVCPACRRISERLPSGHVELRGPFFEVHREEVLNLVRNIEDREKRQHPLERIMSIEDEQDHTLVSTTGIHLARGIGDALARAHKGELSVDYPKAENRIRISWSR